MSELRAHLAGYVALRRSLGFVVREGDFLLPSFVSYLEGLGACHVTTELALSWANASRGSLPVSRSQRLGAVRGFAKYLKAFDELTEVPPVDLLPARYSRVTPYLYSDEDVEALMRAARSLSPPLRACTYETLVGLLSVSGIRVGEAAGLDRDDVDLARSLLVVRAAKRGAAREVPLHHTALVAIARYGEMRDRYIEQSSSPSLFVTTLGTRLGLCTLGQTFRSLVAIAGLEPRGGRCRPRAHDLRHSYAVKTLLGWQRAGVDVDLAVPLLSKVLGHANPASTYWYFEAAPELMALTARRAAPMFGALQ